MARSSDAPSIWVALPVSAAATATLLIAEAKSTETSTPLGSGALAVDNTSATGSGVEPDVDPLARDVTTSSETRSGFSARVTASLGFSVDSGGSSRSLLDMGPETAAPLAWGGLLARGSLEREDGARLVRLVGANGVADGRCGVTLARSSVELDDTFGGTLVRLVDGDGITDGRCGATLARSSVELDAAFGGMLVRLVGAEGVTDGRCGVTLARSSLELDDGAFGGMLVRLVDGDGVADRRCGVRLARSSLELDDGAFGGMLLRLADGTGATEGRCGATLARISLELDDTFDEVVDCSGVATALGGALVRVDGAGGVTEERGSVSPILLEDAFSRVVTARGLTEPRWLEVDLGAASPGRSSPGRDSVAPSGAPVRVFVGATEGRFSVGAAFTVGVPLGTLG